MCGKVASGQPYPFLLVGNFGVPPICRGSFLPNSNSISAERMCFQRLGKIEGFFRTGPLVALSVFEVESWKRPASYMNNRVNVTEARIWL